MTRLSEMYPPEKVARIEAHEATGGRVTGVVERDGVAYQLIEFPVFDDNYEPAGHQVISLPVGTLGEES